jgi:hypothetical protein
MTDLTSRNDALRRRREELGWTRADAAAEVSADPVDGVPCDEQNFKLWENKGVVPLPRTQRAVCKALAVSPVQLGWKPPGWKPPPDWDWLREQSPADPPEHDESGDDMDPNRREVVAAGAAALVGVCGVCGGLGAVLTPDDGERLALAADRPMRVDSAVVESLAAVLAAQRRLDDALGPAAVLPAALPQVDLATRLLQGSRGPARDALAPMVAQWIQFNGWLHAELGDARAIRMLSDAEEMADEIGDGVLAAQALNRKAYVARQRGRHRVAVRHYLAACHTTGAHPAQRAECMSMAAHSCAAAGERADARRLLAEAEGLARKAGDPPETVYWLTPDFHHLGIGLALAELGERAAAVEHLSAGLGALPPDQRDAQWTADFHAAFDRAQGA